MPNKSQEENMRLLLNALRNAGDKGLTPGEAHRALFGEDARKMSITKKLLEHLRAKGYVQAKMGRSGLYYVVAPGR